MRYIFFFSYSRKNSEKFLLEFYEDLRDRIAELEGLDAAQVSFIDKDLELGTDWKPAIIEALQNSSVLLCAYSPYYLCSEYCGREWHIFQMRRSMYPQPHAGMNILPATIKPIIWLPSTMHLVPERVHPVVLDLQYKLGDTKAIQNTDGVKQMLRMRNRYRQRYLEFIDLLARDIIHTARLDPALPELARPLPLLSDVMPLFPITFAPPGAADAPAPVPPSPPSNPPLLFVCVSSAPQWRPFAAAGETIENLVQIMAVEDLNMMCWVRNVMTTDDIDKHIESAAERSQALVLLVDAGAIHLLPDGVTELPHGLVVVIGQNPPASLPSAVIPWLYVASVSELRAVVAERVPCLRSKVRSDSAVYLPALTMSKPIISASHTQRPF